MSWTRNPCSGEMLRITFMRTVLLNVTTNASQAENQYTLSGYEKRLLDVLVSTLNFTYSLKRHPDGHYGTMLKNHSWTGAVGILERNEADVALSKLTDTYPRRAVIDYSIPYFVEPHHFYIGNKLTTKLRPLFLSPFANEIWLLIILCLVVCVVLMRLFSTRKRLDTLFYLHYVISITLGQGGAFWNKNGHQLAVTFVWLLSCLFIRVHFGNALRASTSVYKYNNVDTLEKIAVLFENGQLNLVIPAHNSFVEFIRGMPVSSRYGKVYRRASVIRPYNDEVYLETERGRSVIILGRKATILNSIERPGIKISPVNEPLTTLNIALGLNKNLSCSRNINQVLQVLWESGCLEEWEEDIMRESVSREQRKTKDNNDNGVRYIGLEDLESTFAILITSYCLSFLLIFFYEGKYYLKLRCNVSREI